MARILSYRDEGMRRCDWLETSHNLEIQTELIQAREFLQPITARCLPEKIGFWDVPGCGLVPSLNLELEYLKSYNLSTLKTR